MQGLACCSSSLAQLLRLGHSFQLFWGHPPRIHALQTRAVRMPEESECFARWQGHAMVSMPARSPGARGPSNISTEHLTCLVRFRERFRGGSSSGNCPSAAPVPSSHPPPPPPPPPSEPSDVLPMPHPRALQPAAPGMRRACWRGRQQQLTGALCCELTQRARPRRLAVFSEPCCPAEVPGPSAGSRRLATGQRQCPAVRRAIGSQRPSEKHRT